MFCATAVIVCTAPAFAQGDQAPTHEQVSQATEFLFVQNTASGSFKDGRLTLEKGGPIIFFSDRPYRIFGHTDLEHFVTAWDKGPDSFAENPPNAVLSLLGDQVESFVVVLSNPTLHDGTITYTVQVDEGVIPESFGAASLFIDNEAWAAVGGLAVGRLSARRQQTREAAAFKEGQATAHQDQATYYQAQPAVSSDSASAKAASSSSASTPEQQLEQLKDMLDKGLISQDDYEKKKQEILKTL